MSGIRLRKTLCGNAINKISLARQKKESKLTRNGRRNSNWPFPKPEKQRTINRSVEQRKIGKADGWLAMGGRNLSRRASVVVEISKTTRPKLLRRNSRRDLSTKVRPPKHHHVEERARQARKDDILPHLTPFEIFSS